MVHSWSVYWGWNSNGRFGNQSRSETSAVKLYTVRHPDYCIMAGHEQFAKNRSGGKILVETKTEEGQIK